MKYIYFFAIIILASSCGPYKKGSGNIVTSKRNIGVFTTVKASESIDVDVQQGSTASVTVEADDNVMDLVETSVANNELEIKMKGNTNLSNASIKVHVIAPQYDALSTSSSATITSKNTLSNIVKIVLTASSSSKIDVAVDAPIISTEASSSADINAKGKTKNLQAEASSSATLNLTDLKAETVIANASSSSNINVFASIKLVAEANSSADITYKGGATDVSKTENSSGTVSKK